MEALKFAHIVILMSYNYQMYKDFPNKYFIEETIHATKYANFLLHYKYKSGSDWLEIKEELRMKITNDK